MHRYRLTHPHYNKRMQSGQVTARAMVADARRYPVNRALHDNS